MKHLETIKAALEQVQLTTYGHQKRTYVTEALAAVEELERDYVIVPREFYLTKEQYAAQITFDPDFPECMRQQYIDETYSVDKSEYESIIAAASQED